MNSTFETRAHAQAVLDYIEEHPEKHDQSNWVMNYESGLSENMCGTTMCVAGTSVYLTDGFDGLVHHHIYGGWSDAAAKNLGLSIDESLALFFMMDNQNAVEMLRAVADGNSEKFWELAEEE